MLQVDEAYWRVISVEQKFLLADKYCTMLRKAESDISTALEEGTMTKADLLKVRVTLNEAEMSRQKAEDGLQLSKMALCQLVGLPLDTDVKLDDSDLENPSLATQKDVEMDDVFHKRREVQMLESAEKIAKAGVWMSASTLMPNIVANASYITTNPNMQNGFQNKFAGSFTAGVVVNVPLAHADDIYKLKAAKHKAKTIELQIAEAKEKIELQVTQSAQQLTTANRKLVAANANIENAEENLRLAQEAFNEGMLTSTELLGAQTKWLKAYSEKIDAAIDLRMAEVYLRNHTGKSCK
jgi:outer membrane protein TolC